MSIDSTLKVGDKVTIVRAEHASDNGRTGVIDEIDQEDRALPYRIVGEDGWFIAWACEVRKVEDDGTLKVGDYVQVVKDREWTSGDVGRRGRLIQIDIDAIPYRVAFEDGACTWVMDVRKVSESTASPFAAHVEEAKRLLAGTDFTGADVIRLAELLCSKAA